MVDGVQVCIQILQEITTRLQIKKTTEKKKLGFDIALNYQNKLVRCADAGDDDGHDGGGWW